HPRGRTRTSRSELLPSQVSQGNNGVFPVPILLILGEEGGTQGDQDQPQRAAAFQAPG
ncbi:hypothetical protein Q8A73_024504, partial [Channa argus]